MEIEYELGNNVPKLLLELGTGFIFGLFSVIVTSENKTEHTFEKCCTIVGDFVIIRARIG